MKLRTKVLSLVLGILLASFLALSIPLYWYTRSSLENELDKRLLAVCEVVTKNLDRTLLQVLIHEPSLSTVQDNLEAQLAGFLVAEIEGLIVYDGRGTELLKVERNPERDVSVEELLRNLALGDSETGQAVSEVYELPGRGFFKAAAVTVGDTGGMSGVVVAWGGAPFMAVVEEMVGSVFWIVLLSSLVAVSLAFVFSQSLIRPVRQLSRYARSIRENIHSPQVHSSRSDEFGDLNRSLVDMHSEIRDHEYATKQLLSAIAHEIKNPLGGMEIYSGLLQEELTEGNLSGNSDEHRKYLEKIITELHRLNQIVAEYLDYARPVKSELKSVRIQTVVEDAYRILLPEVRHRKVHYSLSGRGTVLGDESKLRRVFVNLLKNSLEAVREEGSIDVRVLENDSMVSVEFTDTGPGIPESDLDHIFQPYFTTRDKGYGLGLTIAKNIVDEMNGTIVVDSTAGKGTRFTVKFPRESHG
ncbi:MAG: ATP-binding protein [Fidelibacterota bacterium]